MVEFRARPAGRFRFGHPDCWHATQREPSDGTVPAGAFPITSRVYVTRSPSRSARDQPRRSQTLCRVGLPERIGRSNGAPRRERCSEADWPECRRFEYCPQLQRRGRSPPCSPQDPTTAQLGDGPNAVRQDDRVADVEIRSRGVSHPAFRWRIPTRRPERDGARLHEVREREKWST
jgi:hypothetical protein